MQKVFFHSGDAVFRFPGKTALKNFVGDIFKREKKPLASIHYIFCSDDYLLQINRDFLKHDFYTDIITFNLAEKGKAVEAEVFISVDRVKDNASSLGISQKEEFLRVIFHGALHLCGYKDKTKADIKTMRGGEDYYLRLYKKRIPE